MAFGDDNTWLYGPRSNEMRLDKLSRDTILTATVVSTRQLWFRVWLSTLLIRTAAWILGCSVEIIKKEP